MGLSVCTDCGGKVSDRATKCPHCGAPGPAAAKNQPVKNPRDVQSGKTPASPPHPQSRNGLDVDGRADKAVGGLTSRSPYIVLFICPMTFGATGFSGMCLLACAAGGAGQAKLFLALVWGLPFLWSLFALPSVLKHTITGKPYPDGVDAHSLKAIGSLLLYLLMVPTLAYALIPMFLDMP